MDQNDLTRGSVFKKLLLFIFLPVSFFMSKITGVSLFQVGLATPCATVFAIVITTVYTIHFERTRRIGKECICDVGHGEGQ